MKKKFKLFATIATLCLTLAIFTFGVFSALTVTYKTTGTVSYEIEDTFVELETRVYSTSKQFTGNSGLATTSESLASKGFTALNAMEALETENFNKVQMFNVSTPTSWAENNEDYFYSYSSVETPAESPEDVELALSYSTTKGNEKGVYTYFVITKLVNKSTLPLYAYVNFTDSNPDDEIIENYVAPENSYTYKISEYKELNGLNSETYIVFAMSLRDITVPINLSEFVYPITITKDLPENVTFSDEADVIELDGLYMDTNGDGSSEEVDGYVGNMGEMASLDLKDIQIPAGEEFWVEMDITSKDAANYQKLVLSYEGVPAGIEINSPSLILPKYDATAAEPYYGIYYIRFINTTSVPQYLDYVQFNISTQPLTSLLLKDTTNGYEYVEMGTIATETGNEYVRWRKVAGTEGQMKGTYVLETDVHSIVLNKFLAMTDVEIEEYINSGAPLGTMVLFNEKQSDGNSYKDSLVREYLNTGDTVAKFGQGSESSNFVRDLNIDIEGEVFNAITPRDFGYEEDDYFWLLSYEEVVTYLCGGTFDATKADWSADNNTSYYWLRDSYTALPNGACTIHSDGTFGYNTVDTRFIAARAAFVIE